MNQDCQKGFSLIELLVVLAISSIVMTALYSAYHSQHRSYLIQEQVAALQQNLRSARLILEKDLRMAGYDPDPDTAPDPGILSTHTDGDSNPDQSDSDTIIFSFYATNDGVDNDGDGALDDAGELSTIRYDLYDALGDGDSELGRTPNRDRAGAVRQAIAQNIDAINFIYLDSDNNVLNHNGGLWDQPDQPGDIRSVEITIVARADREDRDYTDTRVYRNQQDEDGDGNLDVVLAAQNDQFRRQALTFQVHCRNLEL